MKIPKKVKKIIAALFLTGILGGSFSLITSAKTTEITPLEEETHTLVTEVFSDVTAGSWYIDAVQYVYDNGIMSGSNGLFKPTGNITRAQVVTTLYRLDGAPKVTDKAALIEFTDIAESKYYTDAVCWAYAEGIATGNGGKFDPNGKLTRQQMAAFFFRYAGYAGLDTEVRRNISGMLGADKVSGYAKDSVEWAVGAGLISGSDVTIDGVVMKDLNPRGNTTRAQVAVILQRFCENYDVNVNEEDLVNLISPKIYLNDYDSYGWANGFSFPVMKNGLWGLVNYNGETIVEPAYAELWYYPNENGYAIFRDEEGFHIVGNDGSIRTYYGHIQQIRVGENDIVSYELMGDGSEFVKSSIYENLDGSVIYREDYTWEDPYLDDYYNIFATPFHEGKAYVCKTVEGIPALVELLSDGSYNLLKREVGNLGAADAVLPYLPISSGADNHIVCRINPIDGITLVDTSTLERTKIIGAIDLAAIPGVEENGISYNLTHMKYYVDGNGINNYKNFGCARVTLPKGNTKDVLFDFFGASTEYAIEKCVAAYDEILFDNFDYLAVRSGEEWFYIDYQGNVVSKSYKDATAFNDEGYALVVEDDGNAYVINQAFEVMGSVGVAETVTTYGEMFNVDNEYVFYYGELYR